MCLKWLDMGYPGPQDRLLSQGNSIGTSIILISAAESIFLKLCKKNKKNLITVLLRSSFAFKSAEESWRKWYLRININHFLKSGFFSEKIGKEIRKILIDYWTLNLNYF